MRKEKIFDTLYIRSMTDLEHLDCFDCKYSDIVFILDELSHSAFFGKLHELKSRGISVLLIKNGKTIIDDLLEGFDQVILEEK